MLDPCEKSVRKIGESLEPHLTLCLCPVNITFPPFIFFSFFVFLSSRSEYKSFHFASMVYDIIIIYMLVYCCNWTHLRGLQLSFCLCLAIKHAILTQYCSVFIPGSKSLFAFCKQRASLPRIVKLYVQHLFGL